MKKFLMMAATALMVSNSTFAGGILTNTNQNAAFLRNPARGAVIAIDGVYSNPAGIAFMPEGFHLSVSWQAAWQKRQMDVTNPLFGLNADKQGATRSFEGVAKAPIIPSFQAAYVINDKWSVSAQFAVGGGGGKCEFAEGLPMFEELIGGTLMQGVATNPQLPGASLAGYGFQQNLTGKQYFYGFQVGGTYKLANNFSVFGGLRGVLANCSYTGAITNIAGDVKLSDAMAQVMGTPILPGAAKSDDLVLDCSQSGFGITPIIGLDWNLGKLNLAAKYEFRTKINLENESNNSANLDAMASQVPAVAVYADGAKVRSDIPAILTLGAMYQITDNFRAMGGFHYYWDKDAKGTPIKKGDNTWEANLGVEWDVNDKILLSLGGQRTQYGFDDTDMADTNFNISSTAICVGGAYKFSEKMKLNVGYMHSFYGNHEFINKNSTTCDYTRKNDVVGASFDITF